MPNSHEIHLPFNRKNLVFNQFQDEMERQFPNDNYKNKISYSYFLRVWKLNCSNIKVRRWSKFSKCDFCINIMKEYQEHSIIKKD